MECKTQNGQALIEFLVLMISFACLYSVIRYKAIDLKNTKHYRWEKR